MTIDSGGAGNGTGAVVIQAAPNTGGQRSGTVFIAGQPFSATQAAPAATACGALDVTSQMSVSPSGLGFIGLNLFSQSIVVRNTSGSLIHGPVYLVLIGEPTHFGFPHDSFLVGGGATTICFNPQGDYLVLVSGNLAPGQSGSSSLSWTTQTFGAVRFSIKVLSGTPSH
jgi:hypothetical protein